MTWCQKWDHFASVCRKRLRDFGGKTVHALAESEGRGNEANLLTFSVESSDERPSQDDWHVSLKIADTSMSFKLDSGAECNVISKSLLAQLPVGPKQTRQCKAKLGEIKGVQHKIQIDPNATPVVHPPRRVSVALCEPLKEELQRVEKLGVIKKYTEPTAWVHSLVVAKKKNSKLRVCLDPSDLNRAIMHEHFPLQTVEDMISRINNANHGFWQVKLA